MIHPQEEVWPDGTTHFGLKISFAWKVSILKSKFHFVLFFYVHTHIRDNQEECYQMWSGLTHYALFYYQELKEQMKEKG